MFLINSKKNQIILFFRRLFKEKPLGFVCAILTFFFIFVGLFADLLAPYGMNETDLEKLDGITNGTAAANKAPA